MKKAGYEKSPGSTLKTADIERNKRETVSESRKPGLRSGNRVVLQVEDGFLTKIDEDLPFTRHVVSAVEKIDLVEDFKELCL